MEFSFLKLLCPFAPYENKLKLLYESEKAILSLETFEYFNLSQPEPVVRW